MVRQRHSVVFSRRGRHSGVLFEGFTEEAASTVEGNVHSRRQRSEGIQCERQLEGNKEAASSSGTQLAGTQAECKMQNVLVWQIKE